MPPSPPKSQEDVLLKRASQGDRQAFGDLYETHLDQIYRYIYYRVANAFEAEDLTETVFRKSPAWIIFALGCTASPTMWSSITIAVASRRFRWMKH